MKSVTQIQILAKAVSVSFYTHTLWKCMTSVSSPSHQEQILGLVGFFETLNYTLKLLHSKIDLVSHPAHTGFVHSLSTLQTESGGVPCGVMVKALDCTIVVRDFKLQSCYYVHFWTNTLGNVMNPLILPSMS